MANSRSVRTDESKAAISRIDAQKLQENLCGLVILPGDELYDQARRVQNVLVDKRPAAIVRCMDIADVIQSIHFAREHKLHVAVRSGGQNVAGLGSAVNGLVIDLGSMAGVQVDPKKRIAAVLGGTTQGDLDHAASAYALVTPTGIISSTGIGGLALGGGIGYLTRQYGLTIDNLRSVEMVLADGHIVTASETENEDLFWAVRGGGGNFGVVTTFTLRLHPLSQVYAGPTFWPVDKAKEVMQFYRDFISKAPEGINGWFSFMVVPPDATLYPKKLHNKLVCSVVWCYTGPLERAEDAFIPIRKFGPPILDKLGPIEYVRLQRMFDSLYTPGNQWYWKSDFVRELSDEAIDQHIAWSAKLPSPQSSMQLLPVNGAVHKLKTDATAFSFRDATWVQLIAGAVARPSKREAMIKWANNYETAIRPGTLGGPYVNFMMEDEQERVKAAYRDNYDRLARVKAKYDPDNFFRVNINLNPVKE
jgi:hypothetical protein